MCQKESLFFSQKNSPQSNMLCAVVHLRSYLPHFQIWYSLFTSGENRRKSLSLRLTRDTFAEMFVRPVHPSTVRELEPARKRELRQRGGTSEEGGEAKRGKEKISASKNQKRSGHGIFGAVCSAKAGSLGQPQTCCQEPERQEKEEERMLGSRGGCSGGKTESTEKKKRGNTNMFWKSIKFIGPHKLLITLKTMNVSTGPRFL